MDNEDNTWTSCCMRVDRHACLFFSQLTLSLFVTTFSAYQLIAEKDSCSSQQLHSSLITLILGAWLPCPRFAPIAEWLRIIKTNNTMTKAFTETIVYYMNIAETYTELPDGPSRREWVVEKLSRRFKDIDDDVIGYSVDLLCSLVKSAITLKLGDRKRSKCCPFLKWSTIAVHVK